MYNFIEREKLFLSSLDKAFWMNKLKRNKSVGEKMVNQEYEIGLEHQERSLESKKKNPPSEENDPLWSIKINVLKVLKKGPNCVSNLAVITGNPPKKIRKALEEMINTVEKRNYPFLNSKPDYQMWGIIRPRIYKFLKNKILNIKKG